MNRPAQRLLPVCSAGLLSFSLPPFDAGFLAWVGLAPLLFSLRREGVIFAAGLAFLFGLCCGVGTYFWQAVGFDIFLLMAVIFSLYYALFGACYRFAAQAVGPWILVVGPALWVAIEYARSNLFFLAWPTNLLGLSQYRYLPMIQVADVAGIYGVSFAIVMVNQVLSELLDKLDISRSSSSPGRTVFFSTEIFTVPVLTVAGIMALLFLYGWGRPKDLQSQKAIRVALVQPNVLVRNKMPYADQVQHLRVYRELTEEAVKKKPDLIVWPSSSLPAPIHGSRLVRLTLEEQAQKARAHLVAGGAGYEKSRTQRERDVPYANSEFLISPSGEVEAQYNKMLLVPFNEYLPFGGRVSWPRWLTTVKESFLAGKEHTLFRVGEAKFGTPICWENMFPDFFRRFVVEGANLMVSVANEAGLGVTAAPYETLAMSVFRAVENRVAVVRATTTGISAFINPDGEIAEKITDGNGKDLFVSGFSVRDVPLMERKTFYTLHGDVFAYVAVGIAILTILTALRAKARTDPRS